MIFADRRYLSPADVMGRLVTCTSCGTLVDVIEIDLARGTTHWIDADDYVCGPCLKPVQAEPTTLEERLRAARDYDPRTAAIPF